MHKYGLIFYILITAITSCPFFIKHFPSQLFFFIPLYFIFLISISIIIKDKWLARIKYTNNMRFILLMILILLLANIILYPGTRLIEKPSTAPEALIKPARMMLFEGLNPYSDFLSDGAPVSPGPGWIIINSPFALTGAITFLVPFYLMLLSVLLAKDSILSALSLIIMLFCSLNFLQMSFTGHDLAAAAMALTAIVILVYRNSIPYYISGILAGMVCTARAPLALVPVLIALCMLKDKRRNALNFMTVSLMTCILLHFLFYALSVRQGFYYQPLHVFNRASSSIPLHFMLLSGFFILTISALAFTKVRSSLSSWCFFIWITISLPFILTGFSELIRDGILHIGTWADWEGKGYVSFTLPLLITSFISSKDN